MGLNVAQSSFGQSRLFLLLIVIGVLASLALTIDGKMSFNVMHTAEDAAAAGARQAASFLKDTQSISEAEEIGEAELMAAINEMVEANGIADSDRRGGNEVNDNVAAYYTDVDGNRISGCSEVGLCGTVPANAEYIKVVVVNDYDPFIAKVLGIDSLGIASSSIVPIPFK